MQSMQHIEVFSAGCPVCRDTIEMVNRMAGGSRRITVLDMNDSKVAERAKHLGIHSVPAVLIDGVLADCCAGRGPDEDTLRQALKP